MKFVPLTIHRQLNNQRMHVGQLNYQMECHPNSSVELNISSISFAIVETNTHHMYLQFAQNIV